MSKMSLGNIEPGLLPSDIQKTKISIDSSKNGGLHEFRNGTKITFHFRTSLSDEPEVILDDSREMKKPMELILGKQFKLEVWEACIKTMVVGEVSEFKVPTKYVLAYPILSKTLRDAQKPEGSHKSHSCCGMMSQGCGYPDLDKLIEKPRSLTFIFEIISILKPGEYEQESWELTLDEKLASIPKLKEKGNHKFGNGDIQGAKVDYFEALGRLEQLGLSEKPGSTEHQEFENMKVPLLLNYSFCLMKEGDYYEGLRHLDTALTIDPNNSKAYFRRARMHRKIGNFNEARNDYAKVLELNPSLSNSVNSDLNEMIGEEKDKISHDKETFSKLFK